jgi:hypothetical protein
MMTAFTRPPATLWGSLIQIRRGYTTECNDFRLFVETDAEGWKAQVHDRMDGRICYSAQRCNLPAAKIAATEFAVFGLAGEVERKSPEAMARHLRWNEYW